MSARTRSVVTPWRTLLLLFSAAACGIPSEPPNSGSPDPQDETGSPDTPSRLQLHTWWETAGEAEALDTLTSLFRQNHAGVSVQVATVPGGPLGALFDLSSRVTSGVLPDVFVLMSPEVAMWSAYAIPGRAAPVNLLMPLDDILLETGAGSQIPPEILGLNQARGTSYAVPIAVHRHNTMFYNKSLLADLGAEPPDSIEAFETLCDAVEAYNVDRSAEQRIVTLANLAEGFALDVILQSAIVASANAVSPGSGGPYLEAFFDGNKSVRDPEFMAAARFMNTVFRCSNLPSSINQHLCEGGDDAGGPCSTDDECGGEGSCVPGRCEGGTNAGAICSDHAECGGSAECAFQYFQDFSVVPSDIARMVQQERAVMFIHGDWTKSEYDIAGFSDYGMAPALGTEGTFIFSLSNLAVFVDGNAPEHGVEFLRTALDPDVQARFAAIKGAVPPRADAPLHLLDEKGRQSAMDFQNATTIQETETIRGWVIWEALIEFWRARHRDGYASSGEQFDADLEAFIANVGWTYEQFKKNPGGSF